MCTPSRTLFIQLRACSLVVAAVAVLCGMPAMAQRTLEDVRFQRISVEQGLSQSIIYSILEDSRGFLWFGTRDGLNKYDGYGFIHYKHHPFDRNGIPSSVIRAVCEHPDGALWIGAFRGGLVRYDRRAGQFAIYRHDPADTASLSDEDITALLIDRGGTVWAGTGQGTLNRAVPAPARNGDGKVRFIRYRNVPSSAASIPPGAIISIFEDREGRLWLGMENYLCLFDRSTGRVTRYRYDTAVPPGGPASIARGVVRAFCQDSSGNIWIGTDGGLCRFTPATGEARRYGPGQQILALAIDPAGVLWFSTGRHLCALDPVTGAITGFLHDPADPRSISSNRVISILFDSKGRGWVGTDKGINRIDRSSARFRTLEGVSPLSELWDLRGVRSIIEDRSGALWIGTGGSGAWLFDRSSGRLRQMRIAATSAAADFVNTIYQDSHGMVWLGTRHGLYRYDRAGQVSRLYRNGNAVIDSLLWNIWSILEDRGGTLWVGTQRGLLALGPGPGNDRWFVNDPADPGSLSYNSVWKVYEDRAGDIWVATPGGVHCYDRRRGRFLRYRHNPDDPASLSHDEAWTIYQDRRGDLWVGSWGGGLSRLDRRSGRFTHYMMEQGLPSNVIHGIQEDDAGNLWASSGGGLSRFDPVRGTILNFDAGDGLQGNEFNPNACWRLRSGEILFGGENGLNSVHPGHFGNTRGAASPMVITAFRKLDSLVSSELFDGATVEILPHENYWSFEFAMLDYDATGRKRYAYRLEGFDEEWIYSGARRYAAYTNLGPGVYTFRVKGSSSEGGWNDEGIAVTVRVLPAFWETWEFQALLAAAAAALAGIAYRGRRLRKRERETALEEARERERRGIAAELHDGPLQDLYGARFVLDSLSDAVTASAGRRDLEQIDDILRGVRAALQNVCGDLQLPGFESGLGEAIRSHARRVPGAGDSIEIQVRVEGDDRHLPGLLSQNLFRIYRTAIANVMKHASARNVRVEIMVDGRSVRMLVQDDGRGFKPPQTLSDLMQGRQYGLLLADAHARAMGGTLEIISAPGEGTTLVVEVERQRSGPFSLRGLRLWRRRSDQNFSE